MEDHPGLYRWVLNAITCIPKREAEGDLTDRRGEGGVTMGAEQSDASRAKEWAAARSW